MKNDGVVIIEDKNLKEKIAQDILTKLPEWFGLPDSTREYIKDSMDCHSLLTARMINM